MSFHDSVSEFSQGEDKPAANWMVTFADLLSLTLTFFALLFSMSSVEQNKWEGVVDSLALRLNPEKDERQEIFTIDFNVAKKPTMLAADLDYLQNILTDKMKRHAILKDIEIDRRDDRLLLVLPSDQMFASGSANLLDSSQTTLQLLGEILGQLGNKIDVIGHTDPNPATGSGYESNWELSLSRANRIAKMLQSAGYGHPITTYGLADSRFHDITGPQNEAARFARARRVDIEVRQTRADAE